MQGCVPVCLLTGMILEHTFYFWLFVSLEQGQEDLRVVLYQICMEVQHAYQKSVFLAEEVVHHFLLLALPKSDA